MNKRYFLLMFLATHALLVFAQQPEFEIRVDKVDGKRIDVLDKRSVISDAEIKSLFIKCTAPAGKVGADFKICFDDKDCVEFKGNVSKELSLPDKADLREKTITIKSKDEVNTFFTFRLSKKRTFEIKTVSTEVALAFDENTGNTKNEFPDEVGKVFVTIKNGGDPDLSYKVFVNDEFCANIPETANGFGVSCDKYPDLRDKTIQIRDNFGETPVFTMRLKGKQGSKGTGAGTSQKPRPAIEEIRSRFPVLSASVYGLQVPSGNRSTAYAGSKYVHIFLDQFGNNVFSTIPQGIANRQYVVHIFYLEPDKDPNQIDYSVNQTAGEFQETLVFNNAGQLETLNLRARDESGEITYHWAHKEFLLSTSTTNIQFDIIRTALKEATSLKQEFETQTLKTYTIKMSKVYHGSFDVGLINSTLENPTFELVTSPTSPSEKVVKKNEGSNRGVVTAMATFYTSPIIMLEKVFGKRGIPDYMLSGRNFLEDHKIYERIYPAIGVGFTDKTLQNLFFGFNWEFARGGSVFGGWHYGKVNVYNTPANFEFEKTPVTTDEFNLRKNSAWKTDFAIGLNVDILIIRNLFRPVASGSGGENN